MAKTSQKKSGLIRWNAIIPLVVFTALVYIYFHFFFDGHIKKIIEWAGYKAIGTEVNIQNFESSFTQARVEIKKIELTNRDNPDFNSLEIASVRFNLNGDALLRMKFVVEEMATEGLQFMSKRSHRGRVAPPAPPKPNDESFAQQLKKKALNQITGQYEDNILGDLGSFLQSGDSKKALDNIENQIASKKLAADLQIKWQTKQSDWNTKIKSLPTEKDLKALKTQFESIKYKDFKSPQELQTSVNQFNELKKQIEEKNNAIKSTTQTLNDDLKALQADSRQLEQQIKTDVNNIKTRFKIPKLDAAQFTKTLFIPYLIPLTEKLDHYKALAEKYLPPKYSKMISDIGKPKSQADSNSEDDNEIQPHPREKGITYEFPITTGYPLFWIQNLKVSSKSNAQADYGDFDGLIQNITSNQRQIKKETTLKLSGDFKSKNILGIHIQASLNNLKEQAEIRAKASVAKYLLHELSLTQSADGTIAIPESTNSASAELSTIGFKTYDIQFKNDFTGVKFSSAAKDKTVNELLSGVLKPISSFDLKASAKGSLKDLDINLSSSLGEKLEQSFNAVLKNKLEEVNQKIKLAINSEVDKQKKQLEQQLSQLAGPYQKDIAAIQAQLNGQNNLINDRIAQAQKDLENKAKNKIQDEGKKAVDALKKKIKW